MKRVACLDSEVVDITLGRLYIITDGEIVDDVGDIREWKNLKFLSGFHFSSPPSVEVDV